MLRVLAAAVAAGALIICASPAVAEGLGDSVTTFANAPNGAATSADGRGEKVPMSADGLNYSAITAATSADGQGESGTAPADGPNDNTGTPANAPDRNATTSADSQDETVITSVDSQDESVTPSTNGLDDSLAAEETDDAVTSAASPHDGLTTSAGLAASLIRLGTRALALTVVPLHQFPAFDAVITHESGWDVFAINPQSGAYGLGQALPAEKMQTHGVDWRFNPLTQIRWTYDYMNARYGSPDGAWAFWQQHHWY
ncbi:transglycosylase SLT domain-containing protein [Nocardia sp. CA-084685]|uniref:aggregation-promoting factor C-terminal-like domain-containing protein n=1 Tax=Nocardia sp. CA-084685 TaxID=3239970 RepID=UPI003D98F8BD